MLNLFMPRSATVFPHKVLRKTPNVVSTVEGQSSRVHSAGRSYLDPDQEPTSLFELLGYI
jgi:hypothetical protein